MVALDEEDEEQLPGNVKSNWEIVRRASANGGLSSQIPEEEPAVELLKLKRNGKPMNEMDMMVDAVVAQRRKAARAARAAQMELLLAQQRQLDALREQLQEEWFSQWRLVFNLDSGESGSGSVSGSNGASSAAGRTAASAASKYSKGR